MSEPAERIHIEDVTGAAKRKPGRPKKAELAVVEPRPAAAPSGDTGAILGMVERLMIDPNVSVERANQALDFALKIRAEQARMAFDEAVAAAKAEIRPIARNAVGHNNKRYADFSAIAREVDPILGKHGLTYRFRSAQEGAQISITCRLAHKGGHAEETTLFGPADTSGSKNAIQAIGSTTTYLQRYTLVLMLGLAASSDDDGNAAGGSATLTCDQVQILFDLIVETNANLEQFLIAAKASPFEDGDERDIDAVKAKLGSIRAGEFGRLHALLQKKKGVGK